VALYPPTYSRDPRTGQLSGWTIDVIRTLGERLGVTGEPVERQTPPDTVACLVAGDCDVAILGDRARAGSAGRLRPPLVELDYTLLVPASVSAGSLADPDRPAVRGS
jgi:hypothetical protein